MKTTIILMIVALLVAAMLFATVAAAMHSLNGIVFGVTTAGGCVGYLLGRVDLWRELRLPPSDRSIESPKE